MKPIQIINWEKIEVPDPTPPRVHGMTDSYKALYDKYNEIIRQEMAAAGITKITCDDDYEDPDGFPTEIIRKKN